MNVNKYRSHEIEEKDKGWIFSDTKKPIKTMKNIICGAMYVGYMLFKDRNSCVGSIPICYNTYETIGE